MSKVRFDLQAATHYGETETKNYKDVISPKRNYFKTFVCMRFFGNFLLVVV